MINVVMCFIMHYMHYNIYIIKAIKKAKTAFTSGLGSKIKNYVQKLKNTKFNIFVFHLILRYEYT